MLGKFRYLFISIACAFIFYSCSDSSFSDDTAESLTYNESTIDFQISPEIELILNPSVVGTFRGVSLGMSRKDVLEIEDAAQLLNENPESLVYRINYSLNQDVDVEYFFDKDSRVVRIQAYLYPQSKDEQKKAYEELLKYFEYAYGSPDNTSENKVVWRNKMGQFQLLLKKQGNVKVHDVEIEINPIVFTPTAVS